MVTTPVSQCKCKKNVIGFDYDNNRWDTIFNSGEYYNYYQRDNNSKFYVKRTYDSIRVFRESDFDFYFIVTDEWEDISDEINF